jgi:uncharacterized protein YigE (DUF2233 family)
VVDGIRSGHWKGGLIALAAVGAIALTSAWQGSEQPPIASMVVDPHVAPITFHWKDDRDSVIGNIGALQNVLAAKQRVLVCAMNGGMYDPDRSPKGLYVENGRTLMPLDTAQGTGNFYLMPNGVFGITYNDEAFVCTSRQYAAKQHVRYATQSGPMLLMHGKINKQFKRGSKNLNIRNGVGVRADGQVVFAISTVEVNFHEFASFFQDQGCTDALYLDGFVSKAYMPEQGIKQLDGRLGVLIAVAPLTSTPKY